MEARRDDYTKNFNSHYRRLDTLARYFTGDSVVAALAKLEKFVVLSTNKMSIEDARYLDELKKYNPNTLGDKVKNDLENDIISLDGYELHIRHLLIKRYFTEKISDEMSENVKTIICSQFSQSKIDYYYKKFNNSECFDSSDIEMTVKFLADKSKLTYYEFINHFTEKFRGDYTSENPVLIEFKDYIHQIYKRVNNDEAKLKKMHQKYHSKVIDDDYHLIENIINSKVIFAAPLEDNNIKRNEYNHGEINVIRYLLDKKIEGEYYIGVSKLSCYDCASDITLINSTDKNIMLLVRGKHDVKFTDERKEFEQISEIKTHEVAESKISKYLQYAGSKPVFVFSNKEELAEFLSRKSVKMNEYSFLQADVSESETEKDASSTEASPYIALSGASYETTQSDASV